MGKERRSENKKFVEKGEFTAFVKLRPTSTHEFFRHFGISI
jgi:hypothetical protein